MKTAVSLPNELFEDAEALAEELGVTRSELYARAIEDFVKNKRTKDVAKRLKEFYGEGVDVDTAVTSYSRNVLKRVEW